MSIGNGKDWIMVSDLIIHAGITLAHARIFNNQKPDLTRFPHGFLRFPGAPNTKLLAM